MIDRTRSRRWPLSAVAVSLLAFQLGACTSTGSHDQVVAQSSHYQGGVEAPRTEPERHMPRPVAATIPDSWSAIAQPARKTQPGTLETPDPLRVHFLNVGSGSCQIVECPDSADILIADCGAARPGVSDMSRGEIAAFLDSIGFDGEVTVTVSHPHEEHYNRIVPLMGQRKARSIWLGGEFLSYGGEGPDEIGRWLDAQAASGVSIFQGFPAGYANRGAPVSGLQCGSAEVFILTVNSGTGPNDNSMMLMVRHGDFRVIFPGDAGGISEDTAVENFGALLNEVSVLAATNHGAAGTGGNQRSWARATSPQSVVFNTGLAGGNPEKTAGSQYLNYVLPNANRHVMWWSPKASGTTATFETTQAIYATGLNGRIVVESDGSQFSLQCVRNGAAEDCF